MSALSLAAASPPFVLVLDIGTSSLRAVLYDGEARQIGDTLARRTYVARTTEDGGSELDADEMFDAFCLVLDQALASIAGRIPIAAVATSSLAYNVLGLDEQDQPLTPVFLYSDTRNARAVQELGKRIDWTPIYVRTGCPLHTGYLPARFEWLRETQPKLFDRAAKWVSLQEFFLLKLFGNKILSHSFASWSGMMNHKTLDWDEEVLGIVAVAREKLSPLGSVKDSLKGLNEEYGGRWPGLKLVPFFPAVGDGAAANLGSGCTDSTRIAVTIGTSGAMRVIVPASPAALPLIPPGLWLYRVDEGRSLLGGSLNNGGNVFSYLSKLLQLPERTALESELELQEADAHGLTILPFFAGERSPGYRGDARAVISGWSFDTRPIEIMRAALEAIAYRLALIYELLREAIPPPREIIASGSALIHSPAWSQILADVLAQPVIVSGEAEASARGAASLALETIGAIQDVSDMIAAPGRTFVPNHEHHEKYLRALDRQKELYSIVLEH